MVPPNKILRRKIGGRPYKAYGDKTMDLCIKDITNKVLTQRDAAEKYKIPRSSIILKLKAIRKNKLNSPGRQCIFLPSEEKAFVEHAISMCKFGFPITLFDLRYIVKMYLDSQDRKVPVFKKNLPGKRWAECFLERHKKEFSQRFCSNIKRVRAAVNEEIINSFFTHLENEIKDVPPNRIYNYDETNLVDDPGKKRILSKRGCKYPEAIKNSTKASVSIMVCGNAAGEVCPPYVNYKAEKMWDTWTEGGPQNARYNRSKSGWFDSSSFEDWFFSIILPVLRRENEKKVIIGDNLSSHISLKVLKACEEHNIAFIALPPNATHLTQPLDIAYFRPFKCHWRQILDEWKTTPEGQRMPTVPKNIFPSLLNELWKKILPKSETNLQAGFRKAGIYPLCATKVLERLPSYCNPNDTDLDLSAVSDTFIKYIEMTRKQAVDQGTNTNKRKRKLNVEPGKSISAEDVEKFAFPSTSNIPVFPKKQKNSRKAKAIEDSSEEDEEDRYSLASDTSLNLSDSEEAFNKTLSQSVLNDGYLPAKEDFVVVNYEGEYWPGQVMKVETNGAYIKCMTRSGNMWKWPEKEDCLFYEKQDIKLSISQPKQRSTRRELFYVPELEDIWNK